MFNTLIIIPTYNEKENIALIIDAVFNQKLSVHILIIDDNSPDGTAGIVKELMPKYANKLFLEIRQDKNGLGTAYIHGFKWALQRNYKYIIEMDADFSHDPKDIIRLQESCELNGADVCIGSRYVNNKINVINWDFKRVFLSYFASKYVRFFTRIPIYDTTAGFICWKREVLEKIDLNKVEFVGYAFQIEMKFKAWKHQYNINEVSVIFTDRTRGVSKISGGIFYEALFGVIKMRLKGLPKK